MQLTERQCWEVVRKMVKDKNEEYKSFLLMFLDTDQMRQVLGRTRDSFLKQSGFSSSAEFNGFIRQNCKREPVQDWLNNLSAEDLLLFLDFRCKVLQGLYKHYKMYRTINKNDINGIIDTTKVSNFIQYNYGKLVCSGKPKKTELDNAQKFDIEGKNEKEAVISQLMSNIAVTFAHEKNKSLDKALEEVVKITTYNIDANGYVTGHKFMGNVTDNGKIIEVNNRPLKMPERKPVDPEHEFTIAGFDKNKMPIYIYRGQYVNFFRQPIINPQFVYDANMKLIEDEFKR